MKRAWKVEEDSSNSLVILNEDGDKMCELISEENETTDSEKARMEWICKVCNASKIAPPLV